MELDKQQQPHIIRFVGTAALLAALGLAFACSESPTEATPDDLAPQFARGGGKGKPPDGGGDGEQIEVEVVTALGADGLYDDGDGKYPATNNVWLEPACGSRFLDLKLEALTDGPPISNCQGRRDGRVRLSIPGVLDVTKTSSIGADPVRTVNGCNFSGALKYFFLVDSDGDGGFRTNKDDDYTLVWTNGQVTAVSSVGGTTEWTVEASEADLYIEGIDECATADGRPADAGRRGLTVALNVVVRRIP